MNKARFTGGVAMCALAAVMGLSGCGGSGAPAAAPKDKPVMSAKLDEAFIARSYDGGRLLVVNFKVTNNDPEMELTPSMFTYKVEASIGDEDLEQTYLSENNPGYVNSDKKIPEGESALGQAVFELEDAKEGTVELSADMDSVDYSTTVEVIDEKIDLADLEERVSESDFEVKLSGHKVTADEDGQPVLLLDLSFTNNSKKPAAFSATVDEKLFQNGVELDPTYLSSYFNADVDDEKSRNASKEVQPGTTIDVQVAFALQDGSAPVEYSLVDIETPDQAVVLGGELELS